MNVIIVGCGRVGAELALLLGRRGHDVTVIDHVGSSFGHLDPAYRGRTIEAEPLARGRPREGGDPGDAGARHGHELGRGQRRGGPRGAHGLRRAERGRPQLRPPLAGAPRGDGPHLGELHRLGRPADRGAPGAAAAAGGLLGGQRRGGALRGCRCRRRWVGRTLGALVAGIPCSPVSLTHGGRASLPEPERVLRSGRHRPRDGDARGGRPAGPAPRGDGGLSMRILIAGGGRTGATLALTLHAQKHEVRLMEHRPSVLAHIHRELPTELIYEGNPNDPRTLEFARIADAQVLVASMSSDAENLALCFIAREHFKVPAHDRHHQRPALRLALRAPLPRGRGGEPGRHPGRPHRAGAVGRGHDDAPEAAQGELLAGERDAGRATPARWAGPCATSSSRATRSCAPSCGATTSSSRAATCASRRGTRCWPSWTRRRRRSWRRSSGRRRGTAA